MKKYIAVLKQEGGCDHTIGCGIKIIQFNAVDSIDAGKQLKEMASVHYTGEHSLSVLEYYEIAAAYEVDLKRWYSEFEQNEIQRKELIELERLKKKYNQ
jgi:hypothetical protein